MQGQMLTGGRVARGRDDGRWKEQIMKLESGWVPVALSSSIEAKTSTGAIVEGIEIVVWRDANGAAHVWEDRCPHRGMRLSFGFVRGDHIACLYHGWQYDTAGQCRHIPAHPELDVPATIKVASYRAEERCGIVWATSAGDAAMPSPEPASDITGLRSLSVDVPSVDVEAALVRHGYTPAGADAGTCTIDGVPLFIGLQSAGARRTVLHMVALAGVDIAARKRLSRWAEELRLMLESPELATMESA
jgi:nitrite reductase/ring-hydroxylating ferredoxin subunit